MSIMEVSTSFNSVEIKINLPADELVNLLHCFDALKQAALDRIEFCDKQSIQRRRDDAIAINRMGREAARLARKEGKRLEEIASTLAAAHKVAPEAIIARGQRANEHLKHRHISMRNTAIRRMAREGASYADISQRFDLTAGRISQIVNQNQQGATIQ